jgi:hypothetical protein
VHTLLLPCCCRARGPSVMCSAANQCSMLRSRLRWLRLTKVVPRWLCSAPGAGCGLGVRLWWWSRCCVLQQPAGRGAQLPVGGFKPLDKQTPFFGGPAVGNVEAGIPRHTPRLAACLLLRNRGVPLWTREGAKGRVGWGGGGEGVQHCMHF